MKSFESDYCIMEVCKYFFVGLLLLVIFSCYIIFFKINVKLQCSYFMVIIDNGIDIDN